MQKIDDLHYFLESFPIAFGVYEYDAENSSISVQYLNTFAKFCLGHDKATPNDNNEYDFDVFLVKHIKKWILDLKNKNRFSVVYTHNDQKVGSLDLRLFVRFLNEGINGKYSIIVAFVNVTEEMRVSRELHWKNTKFKAISELTHAITYDYDFTTDVMKIYLDENGKTPHETIIKHYISNVMKTDKDFVTTDSEEFYKTFDDVKDGINTGICQYKADYFNKGVRWYRCTWKYMLSHDDNNHHIIGLVEDIEDEIQLKQIAEIDSVTGLNNRYSIQSALNDLLKNPENDGKLIISIIDIDDFKAINDAHGHIKGDDVLHQIGLQITKICRPNDLSGRIGGDEMLIVFKDANMKYVLRTLKKLQKSLDLISKNGIVHSLSVGVCSNDSHERDYKELIDKADRALYHSKQHGKKQISIYDEKSQDLKKGTFIDIDLNDSQYEFFINSLDISLFKHGTETNDLMWANNKFFNLIGYTKTEFETLFQNNTRVFMEANNDEWEKLLENAYSTLKNGNTKFETITKIRKKNGDNIWVRLTSHYTFDDHLRKKVSYSMMVDITETISLVEENSLLYDVIPSMLVRVLLTPEGFNVISANSSYKRCLQECSQYEKDLILGEMNQKSKDRIHARMMKKLPITQVISVITNNNKRNFYSIKGLYVKNSVSEQKVEYVLTYNNITTLMKQKEMSILQNKELEKLAYVDPVTNGMNAIKFELVVKEHISKKEPGFYSLVAFNINKFKIINDISGTDGGNDTLRYVYNCIKKELVNDEQIARIRSDNFIILIKTQKQDQIEERMEKIATNINKFNDTRERKYIMTFSVGVYKITDKSLDFTNMIDRANLARHSSNILSTRLCAINFYSETERQKLILEKDIENSMHDALDANEFVVYLQPKYSLNEKRVVGAEALARWIDKHGNIISPSLFIPVFEKNGFIIQLDKFIFTKTCEMLRRWIDEGKEVVPISVNVSRAHFSMGDFVKDYSDIVKEYKLDPKLIEIELTETLAFDNPSQFSSIVDSLHKAGFTCSMDDFGSGYSSLNILKSIDVDVLKIDRVFFSTPDMTDEKERHIIQAVIDLAKCLNMLVLAEGVETLAQRDFLTQAGCDMIQGYVFSKPIDVKNFEKEYLK